MFKYLSFTGQSGCYANLPLAVLAGASTFTIEFKLATTSTKSSSSNWTWGTIAGREIGGNWQDDFGFCVNNGKLCFWAEPKSNGSSSTRNTTTDAVVNDGLIHKVAVVSSNGAIDLYCDGALVAHTAGVNAKITSTATILLAYNSDNASYLQMDLYEARFWNVARTQEQIFADIDGTETGLQAWYLPSAGGLLDYSGNAYHATLYGNPAYTETDSLDVSFAADVQRTVTNPNWSVDDYLVVHLPFDDSTTFDWCGNEWTLNGTLNVDSTNAISGNALQLTGNGDANYLQLDGIALGGRDFTVHAYVYSDPTNTGNTYNWARFFAIYNPNNMSSCRISMQATKFEINGSTTGSITRGTRHHVAIVYLHSTSTLLTFCDGVKVGTKSVTFAAGVLSRIYIGKSEWSGYSTLTGSIDEFQIYDGIALWTENFTPPTADDYDKDRVDFTADLQRKLTNSIDFAADLQRTITTPIDFTADAQRNIFHGQNFTADLQRNVSSRADFTADLQRTLSNAVDFTIDLQRRIDIPETTFTVDVQRTLTHSVDFTADLQRSLAQRNEFSVDLQRKIFRGQNFTVDLRRNVSNIVDFTADLQRALSNAVDFTIDLQRTFYGKIDFTVDLQSRVYYQWLTRILPESSFLDPKIYASAEALDLEITKFHRAIREVLHLPRLDELNGTILDFLAEQFHVDNYDAINFSDEEKRNLIRQSIAWHRIKGTPAAVQMVLQDAFKDLRISEWYEYGGEPYYFRLWSRGYISTPERFKSFWNMFWDAKNVRSHLEKVTIDISPEEPIKIYTGAAKIVAGMKKIGLPRPRNQDLTVYAGVAKVTTGRKIFGLPRPHDQRVGIYAGAVVIRAGTIHYGTKNYPV